MTQRKFMTIYEALRADILNTKLKYGEQLPSENELVQTYQSSRETVRKALNLLVSEGMIQKIRGKGSIVIYQNITEFPFADLISFKEVQQTLGLQHETEVKVLEKIQASEVPVVKKALNLKQSTWLWHIIRVRKINGKVKIIDEDYLDASIVPDLNEAIVQDSLYHYIEQVLHLEISYSKKSITFEPFEQLEYDIFEDYDVPYVATVRGIVHLEDTTRFQYNISKHIATEFKFNDFSRRHKKK
ncbi:trehalose operon repressor [Staphylococcus sp. HKU1]|uniref:trehalose operon repressor n=1 Tax=unclassified Staphylococcus TaxID=91994 RepID=UPI0020407FC8|nr:trehalose operon repressor [Staphylococcus sp. Marseille-Q6910]